MRCVITNGNVKPEWIIPPHTPYNWRKVNRIARSIKKDGWKGRPILTVRSASWDETEWHRALTGSHRLVAAAKVDLYEIPVKVITIHGRFPWKQMMVWDDYYDVKQWLARHTNKTVVNIFHEDLIS